MSNCQKDIVEERNRRWQKLVSEKLVIFAVLSALALVSVAGCSGIQFRTEDGIDHYLILGIGMVSTREQLGVTVEEAKILGMMVNKGGFNIGLGLQHTVEIVPKSAGNVVISVKSSPYSLKVKSFSPYSSSK